MCALYTEPRHTNLNLIWQNLKESFGISLFSFSFRLVSPLRLTIQINILVSLITLWKFILNGVGWALYLTSLNPWKINSFCTRTPALVVSPMNMRTLALPVSSGSVGEWFWMSFPVSWITPSFPALLSWGAFVITDPHAPTPALKIPLVS